jgi:hypothetical protein
LITCTNCWSETTDGALSTVEREELETLVEMAQFGQIFSTALQAQAKP